MIKKIRITNIDSVRDSQLRWKRGVRQRQCPICESTITYKDKWSFIYACQDNKMCKSCTCKNNSIKYDYKNKFRGENNPFFGRHHTEKTKDSLRSFDHSYSLGDKNPMHRLEIKNIFYQKYSGKNSKMFGRKASDETKKKISIRTSGKNNPMYGKPSPSGSGNGWANWYKGFHFRSLRELQYYITEVEGHGLSCESAQGKKYRIPYKDYNGVDRTYLPDFLVDNKYLIEIKPKKLWNTVVVKSKKEAAEKFCIENGFEYKLVDIEPKSEILRDKYLNGEIRFVEKYKNRFEKYANII